MSDMKTELLPTDQTPSQLGATFTSPSGGHAENAGFSLAGTTA